MALAIRFERMSMSCTDHRSVSRSTSGTTAYAMAARASAKGTMKRSDRRMDLPLSRLHGLHRATVVRNVHLYPPAIRNPTPLCPCVQISIVPIFLYRNHVTNRGRAQPTGRSVRQGNSGKRLFGAGKREECPLERNRKVLADPLGNKTSRPVKRLGFREIFVWPSQFRLMFLSIVVGIISGPAQSSSTGCSPSPSTCSSDRTRATANRAGTRQSVVVAAMAAVHSYWFLVIPALGGLVSGLIVYSLAPEAEGSRDRRDDRIVPPAGREAPAIGSRS